MCGGMKTGPGGNRPVFNVLNFVVAGEYKEKQRHGAQYPDRLLLFLEGWEDLRLIHVQPHEADRWISSRERYGVAYP